VLGSDALASPLVFVFWEVLLSLAAPLSLGRETLIQPRAKLAHSERSECGTKR